MGGIRNLLCEEQGGGGHGDADAISAAVTITSTTMQLKENIYLLNITLQRWRTSPNSNNTENAVMQSS